MRVREASTGAGQEDVMLYIGHGNTLYCLSTFKGRVNGWFYQIFTNYLHQPQ